MTASSTHHHHPASPIWEAHARAALAAQGSRAGGARQLVIAALAGQDCCASAQEIHAQIAINGGTTGIASVYRTLDLLHGLSLITRIDTGDGVARFEPAHPDGAHHHHLVCDTCCSVEAFHDDALETVIHTVADRVDFRVDAHDVVLRGACRTCR